MDCLTAAACPQQAGSRAAAQQLAQSLLEQQLVNPVRSSSGPAAGTDQVEDSSETLYRLRADAAMPGWGSALNSHFQWAGQARDAVTVNAWASRGCLVLGSDHLLLWEDRMCDPCVALFCSLSPLARPTAAVAGAKQ
jgi:hypothetical protein